MTNHKKESMSNLITRLFIAVLFALLPLCSGNALEALANNKIIRVGVYDDPPSVFREGGVVKGINPEIFEAIAHEHGIRFEYIWGSWSEIYHGLLEGRIDTVFDIARTKERENLFDFNNETLMVEWGVIMARKGHKISSPADLLGMKIAGVADDVYFEGHPDSFKEMMKTFGIDCRYVEFGGFTDAANAVMDGKADACVLAKSFADYNLNKSYLDYTPIIFKPVKIHFAFTKDSSIGRELIPLIDASLSAMKSDRKSVFYTAYEKYVRPFSMVEKVPKWLWISIPALFALITIVFSMLHIIMLKRTVHQRTTELLDMNNRLADLSSKDSLTGTANRRTFNERLEHEIERARRYKSDLSLILFDIDFFKSINDRFGHIAGDDVIVNIADIMSSNTRMVDLVARYGGEEFGIILPETSLENACIIAEKIRFMVSIHVEEVGGSEVKLSITGGVAAWIDSFGGMSDFVNAADSALYAGKRSGRNKVVEFRAKL